MAFRLAAFVSVFGTAFGQVCNTDMTAGQVINLAGTEESYEKPCELRGPSEGAPATITAAAGKQAFRANVMVLSGHLVLLAHPPKDQYEGGFAKINNLTIIEGANVTVRAASGAQLKADNGPAFCSDWATVAGSLEVKEPEGSFGGALFAGKHANVTETGFVLVRGASMGKATAIMGGDVDVYGRVESTNYMVGDSGLVSGHRITFHPASHIVASHGHSGVGGVATGKKILAAGTIEATDLVVTDSGGILASDEVNLTGQIVVRNIDSQSGGVVSSDSIMVSGNISAENMQGERAYGALLSGTSITIKGSARLHGKSPMLSSESGGCIRAETLRFLGSSSTICEGSESNQGGALYASSVFLEDEAYVELLNSSAKFQGGAVWAQVVSLAGNSHLKIAVARAPYGGAIYSTTNVLAVPGSSLELRDVRTLNETASHDMDADIDQSALPLDRHCEMCLQTIKPACACDNLSTGGFSQCCNKAVSFAVIWV